MFVDRCIGIGYVPTVVSFFTIKSDQRLFCHFIQKGVFGVNDESKGRDPCRDGTMIDRKEIFVKE
jgi:hypothetical protein